jgi:hypothetical protein
MRYACRKGYHKRCPGRWCTCSCHPREGVPARLVPPRGTEQFRWIDGQLCRWDDDPAEDFGQVWVPVCAWCRRGPLASGERTCGACP